MTFNRLPEGFPNFKGRKLKTKITKRERRKKASELSDLVVRNMRLVRLEDAYCRFIGCDCEKFLNLEVAHLRHRGAGGNPTGDRSTPDLMILFCKKRHQTGRISIDKGTLDVRPLTAQGTRGACSFWIDRRALTMSLAQLGTGEADWVEVAREAWPHVVAWQDDVLLQQVRNLRW